MNQIEKIYAENKESSKFTRGYLDYISTLLKKIDETQIAKLVEIILEARENGSMVFFIGNGGSSATASHFTNDIAIGTRTKGKPFRVVSLTDNTPVITAIANDFGYDNVFYKQLESQMTSDDIVIAISASGNSKNIIKAIEYANQKGCTTVGITGFSGGQLREIVKYSVHVPTDHGEYGPVEDIHMIFDHIIGSYLTLYCQENE